jgi:hypothetical protein
MFFYYCLLHCLFVQISIVVNDDCHGEGALKTKTKNYGAIHMVLLCLALPGRKMDLHLVDMACCSKRHLEGLGVVRTACLLSTLAATGTLLAGRRCEGGGFSACSSERSSTSVRVSLEGHSIFA